MVTYVVLEDKTIVGLFQSKKAAVAYTNKQQSQHHDVTVTIERRLYTPEEIRKKKRFLEKEVEKYDDQ